mmetsp:Transcript_78118/g.187339  ORF Transcript_78118/g.187339 Transcript_78118/m.187339 type:complete len:274 (+) Transcript_78118:125-946(+)
MDVDLHCFGLYHDHGAQPFLRRPRPRHQHHQHDDDELRVHGHRDGDMGGHWLFPGLWQKWSLHRKSGLCLPDEPGHEHVGGNKPARVVLRLLPDGFCDPVLCDYLGLPRRAHELQCVRRNARSLGRPRPRPALPLGLGCRRLDSHSGRSRLCRGHRDPHQRRCFRLCGQRHRWPAAQFCPGTGPRQCALRPPGRILDVVWLAGLRRWIGFELQEWPRTKGCDCHPHSRCILDAELDRHGEDGERKGLQRGRCDWGGGRLDLHLPRCGLCDARL